MDEQQSDRPTEDPSADKPAASEANREPAKSEDVGVGIGDEAIDSGDEKSASELHEANEGRDEGEPS